MVKEIPITQGRVTLVDDEDYGWLSESKWQYNKSTGYVHGRFRSGDGKYRAVQMHRVILKPPQHLDVDHIDGNRLNNQRSNLRPVTDSQNKQNSHGARSDSRTGVRGVVKQRSKKNPYSAECWVNGKRIWLGMHPTLEEADRAAREGRRKHMTHAPECREGRVQA